MVTRNERRGDCCSLPLPAAGLHERVQVRVVPRLGELELGRLLGGALEEDDTRCRKIASPARRKKCRCSMEAEVVVVVPINGERAVDPRIADFDLADNVHVVSAVFDDRPPGQILALKLLHRFFLLLGRQNSPSLGEKNARKPFRLIKKAYRNNLKMSRIIVCR